MLKRIFTILTLLMSGDLMSQSIKNYQFNSTTSTFNSLTGGTRIGIARATSGAGASLDDTVISLPSSVIPFNFYFNGNTYTTLNVSANGFVTFGSTSPSTTLTTPLSSTTAYAGAIAVFARDLNGHFTSTDTGQIWIDTLGTAPNREFVIEWRNFKPNSTSTTNIFKWDFQIRLKEDNSITLAYYYDSTGTTASTFTAQVGLRGANNTLATNVNNRIITNGTHTWTSSGVGTSNSSTTFISRGNRFPSGLTWTFTPPPPCSGTPATGTLNGSSTLCAGSGVKLTLTGSTSATGLNYRWQRSLDSSTWTDVSTGTADSLMSDPLMQKQHFRLILSCNHSSLSDTSDVFTANVSSAPLFRKVPFHIDFENAWTSLCATNDNPDSAVRINPLTGDNAFRRDNDTMSAAWTLPGSGSWSVGRGANGTARSARSHTYSAASGSVGSMTIAFDASSSSLKKAASFYFINTGGSDSIKIYLSTDSGLTYTFLGGRGTASNWTKLIVQLGNINSTKAILRLDVKADNGASDYGVDELSIYNLPRYDLAGISIISPLAGECLGSSSLSYGIARFQNQGTDTIFFASNNLTSRFVLSGANTGSHSRTRTTGFLAPGAFLEDTISSSVSISNVGITSIKAWTTMTGDDSTRNDTASSAHRTLNSNSLPFVESFESNVEGWTVQQVAQTGNWSLLNGSMSNPTLAPRTGNRVAYFNSFSFSSGTRSRLITPCINLTGSGVPYLEFYISQSSAYNTSFDSVYVQVSTDGGATWGTPIYGTGRYNASATTAFWQRHRICLSNYDNQANVKIALLAVGKFGDNIGIEDFSIKKSDANNSVSARSINVCTGDNDTILVAATDPSLKYALFQGNTQIDSTRSGNGSNLSFIINNLTSTQTYKIKVTDDSLNCSGFLPDTVRITVNSLPNINLGNDTAICEGRTITFNAGSGFSNYIWNTNDTTSSIVADTTMTYWVTVTNSNGCINSDTVRLKLNMNPVVNLGPDTALCPNSVINLDGGANMRSYQWSNFAPGRINSVSLPGLYFVVVTDSNGCNGLDQIQIGSLSSPGVYLGPDTIFCSGNVLTLDAGAGLSKYNWSNSDTTRTTNVASGGTISVIVTNSQGCTAYDEIVVTVNPTPGVNLGADDAICFGDSVILDAGNEGNIYNWSTNDTSRRITVKGSGNYSVTVENSFGCVGSDAITLQVNSLPYVFLGYDTALCNGDSMLISGPNDMAFYQWNTNDSIQGIVVYTAGEYSVKAVDVNGCISYDTIEIDINPRPVVNITGSDTTICKGTTASFDAGAGHSTYNWSNGPSTRTNVVSNAGTYFVVVTNSFGCPQVDSVKVSLDSVSKSSLNFTMQAVGNRNFVFTPATTSGLNYNWTFGDGNSSTTGSHLYSAPGVYNVCLKGTNARGCFDSLCQQLTVTSTGKLPSNVQSVSAYPNPFSDGLVVALDLKSQSKVDIVLYDMLGREYVISKAEIVESGMFNKQINTEAMNLPNGMYTIRVSIDGADTFIKVNKAQ